MITPYRAREILKGDSANAAYIIVFPLPFHAALESLILNPLDKKSKVFAFVYS
jgi:hypothetical protein